MNSIEAENIFKRSGLAALSDLECSEHQDIFSIMETEQQAFQEKESEFRSKEYKWPRKPLYNFSRVWEYILPQNVVGSNDFSRLTIIVLFAFSAFQLFPMLTEYLNVYDEGMVLACADRTPIKHIYSKNWVHF